MVRPVQTKQSEEKKTCAASSDFTVSVAKFFIARLVSGLTRSLPYY